MLYNYRIFLITLFSLFLGSSATSQNVGNDWFAADPNATYVKLSVWEDGYYRVTVSDLTATGHDLSSVAADSIQLFYRGIDQPLHIEKTSSGGVSAFYFWGEKNDGTEDSVLYRDPISGLAKPEGQPNLTLSIFSDTAAYFLTWNRDTGKRYLDDSDFNYQNYQPEPSFLFESRLDPNPNDPIDSRYILFGGGIYNSFYALNSSYIEGQGYYFNQGFGKGSALSIDIPTPYAISGSADFEVECNIFEVSQTSHRHVIQWDGTTIKDTIIPGSSVGLRRYTINVTDVLDSVATLQFSAPTFSLVDSNAVSFASVKYPRLPDMGRAFQVSLSDWTKAGPAHFKMENPDGVDSLWAIDPVRGIRSRGIIQGGAAYVIIPLATGQHIHLITDKGIRTPLIQETHSLSDLCAADAGAEFVILTSRKLVNSAQDYADYRANNSVNSFTTKLVFLDEIYDEFGYGTPTPWAIKRFFSCALENWNEKPKYVLLWGNGSFVYRGNPENLMPTYGYPVGDYEFVIPISQGINDFRPKISIGRVSILEDFEGRDYLNKVIDLETQSFDPWRKRALFLGGGANQGEQNAISNGILRFAATVSNDLDTIIYLKGRNLPVDTLAQDTVPYHDLISDGVGLIHYFAHSSASLREVKFRGPTGYQNARRYPLVIEMGGYSGDFSLSESFAERWVKAPNRGCIAYLANSSAGYLSPLREFGLDFYDIQFKVYSGEPIGDAVRLTIGEYLGAQSGVQFQNQARQMVLQGDPSLRLFEARPLSISPDAEDLFQIYPNPVSDRIFIETATSDKIKVNLSTIEGERVRNTIFFGKKRHEMSVAGLSPGIYVMMIQSEKSRTTKKIIVQ